MINLVLAGVLGYQLYCTRNYMMPKWLVAMIVLIMLGNLIVGAVSIYQ